MLGFRRAALHLALAALILRAFLPAGWMPNPQGFGETAFVICTLDGPVTTESKALPGKDDPRAHESCAFAAAGHAAQSTDFITQAAPQLSRTAAPRELASGPATQHTPFSRPASRAPPTLT
jgi:hypothetical protein